MLATQNIIPRKLSPRVAESMHLHSRFLTGLTPLEVEEIVTAAAPVHFLANSVVTNQTQIAGKLFLLTHGRARFFFVTEDGRKLLLHWLVPGEIFGGVALLSEPSSYLVSTEMVENSNALVWNHSAIRRLATKYPRLLDNSLSIALDYMALHVASHVALTCNNARQKLAQTVVTLARTIGHSTRRGIELDVTNEELANASNVTVFTASRLLSEWQRRGLLVKSRCKLLLCSPERLATLEV